MIVSQKPEMEIWKSYYSLSVFALLLPRPRLAGVRFEPGPRHIACVVDNLRVGRIFSEVFGYPPSLQSHQCSTPVANTDPNVMSSGKVHSVFQLTLHPPPKEIKIQLSSTVQSSKSDNK
jgi:hypothetical protein